MSFIDEMTYNSGQGLYPDGAFKFSPSSMSEFFECSASWYAKYVEHTGAFTGNTASITGSIVHAMLAMHAKEEPIDEMQIEAFIGDLKYSDAVNPDKIRKNYYDMFSAGRDYLDEHGIPERTEEYIKIDLGDNYFVGGSADAVIGTTLVDYKSIVGTSYRKTKDFQDPTNTEDNILKYRLQLYTYAWIYTKLGVKIDKIMGLIITTPRVGAVSPKTGKPLKDYPSQAIPIEEPFTKAHFDWIEEQIQTMKLVHMLGKAHPEFLPLLYRDNINSFHHLPKADEQIGMPVDFFSYDEEY